MASRGLLFLLLLLVPGEPAALPVLRLWLSGSAETLGRGGLEVFHDAGAERLALERPALLAGSERGFVSVDLENQHILSLDAGRLAGTYAYDRGLRLTVAAPVGEARGVGFTAFASARHEAGETRLETRSDGELLHSREDRTFASVGVAAALPHGLSVAASAEQSAAGIPGYATEARWAPLRELSLWYQHRRSDARYRLRVPEGAVRGIASPALEYRIAALRRDDEFGGDLRLADGRAHARAHVLAGEPRTHGVELGGRPVEKLLLRAGVDRRVLRFSDYMIAEGSGDIATVDMGLELSRFSAGADLELSPKAGSLHARYVSSTLRADSQAADLGTATARALLDVDLDLGLLFRGNYALDSDQLALGWDRIPMGGDFHVGVGGQLLRVTAERGDYQVTSSTLRQSLARDDLEPARMDAIGLTAHLAWRPDPFEVSLAMAQLVPVSLDDGRSAGGDGGGGGSPGGGGGGSGGGGGDPGGGGGSSSPFDSIGRTLERIGETIDRYGGGNLLLLRASMSF